MMRRTRKWAYVAQEATRLANLGLAPGAIATRLEVQATTVTRWMAAGKLADTRRGTAAPGRSTATVPPSPNDWGAAVRTTYALNATDEELVQMGEAALRMVHDRHAKPSAQLNAMGRFVAIVKQLALPARAAEAAPAPVEAPKAAPPVRQRVGADPRMVLQVVK